MSYTFYTNVQSWGNYILYRGIENNNRIKYKLEYQPTLYIPSNKPSEYRTVTGEYVSPVTPGSMRDCRDFIKKYEDVENFKIYGNQRYEYSYIFETSSKEIQWDRSLINVCNIDIEVGNNHYASDPNRKIKIRKKK